MHILLKATNELKGILVVKHSERDIIAKFLISIKNKYYIIVHCGSMNPPLFHSYIDYNLIPKSRCINNKCIPITSSELLSENFNNDFDIQGININIKTLLHNNDINYSYLDDIENTKTRFFDFICCNRAVPIKKTYNLLQYILEFCKNTPYKVCFIIIEQTGNSYNEYYKQVLDLWRNNFNKNICLIDTHQLKSNNPIYKGFTSSELSNFYKSSKIYMHSCEEEGGCRTINEALCCGCKILAKDNMKGGSLDYINDNNGMLYNNSNYLIKMGEILYSYSTYVYDYTIFKNLNSKFTIDKLLKLLYHNFNYEESLNYTDFKEKCNTVDLEFSFPAHNLSVPWYITGELVSDIKTEEQLNIFSKYI